MIRLIASCALVSLFLAACMQDGSAMAEIEERNGINASAVETPPVSRGSADTRSEQMQPIPEVFETCDIEAVQGWIGRQFFLASETALRQASGASTLRLVRPGQAISMDYQSDRLTIELDGADIILTLRCG